MPLTKAAALRSNVFDFLNEKLEEAKTSSEKRETKSGEF